MNGKCSLKLFVVVNGIRRFVLSTTQEVEGVNSIIRLLSERCRSIGLLLLDARVRIKKALGLGTADQPVKWSHKRPKALALLQDCMRQLDQDTVKNVLCAQHRFATATPQVPITPNTQIVGPAATVAGGWAKAMTLRFHAYMKKANVSKVMTLNGDLSLGSSAFIVVDKYYGQSEAVMLTVVGDPGDPDQPIVQCVVNQPRRYVGALAA